MDRLNDQRKRNYLEALKYRVEAKHASMRPLHEVWFWPTRDGVDGFLGTAPIIVAGLNPSKGRPRRGPSATDTFFYDCLRKEGLANAHITDVVKIRATRNDTLPLLLNPTISQLHREYFEDEMRIVKPAVVAVMGHLVLDVLRAWQFVVREGRRQWAFRVPGERKAAVILTVHPAATRWPKVTAERQVRFRKDVREARRLLDSLR